MNTAFLAVGSDWMTIFLDIDNNPATGWHGYDFVVNRRVKDNSHSMLEWTRTGWNCGQSTRRVRRLFRPLGPVGRRG